jgi:hypothetical protein
MMQIVKATEHISDGLMKGMGEESASLAAQSE